MTVLGIDLGTSATKVLVVDAAGTVCAVGHGDHRPLVKQAGWSEQDPEDWWRSTLQAVAAALAEARLDPGAIDAVGLGREEEIPGEAGAPGDATKEEERGGGGPMGRTK